MKNEAGNKKPKEVAKVKDWLWRILMELNDKYMFVLQI